MVNRLSHFVWLAFLVLMGGCVFSTSNPDSNDQKFCGVNCTLGPDGLPVDNEPFVGILRGAGQPSDADQRREVFNAVWNPGSPSVAVSTPNGTSLGNWPIITGDQKTGTVLVAKGPNGNVVFGEAKLFEGDLSNPEVPAPAAAFVLNEGAPNEAWNILTMKRDSSGTSGTVVNSVDETPVAYSGNPTVEAMTKGPIEIASVNDPSFLMFALGNIWGRVFVLASGPSSVKGVPSSVNLFASYAQTPTALDDGGSNLGD